MDNANNNTAVRANTIKVYENATTYDLVIRLNLTCGILLQSDCWKLKDKVSHYAQRFGLKANSKTVAKAITKGRAIQLTDANAFEMWLSDNKFTALKHCV